ncbi:MAG TPA: HsdR family type I site-specific deoxyribonuclease [Gaiellales bacterium]|nr:HsdR family type I site-specific deoxyribonuclease [Gaiellales bacterium]
MTFSEASTVQAAVIDRLMQPDLGWRLVEANNLGRDKTDVLLEYEVVAALQRLNPILAKRPELVAEVLPKLRAVGLSVIDDGLVTTNERMMSWLRGNEAVHFVGEDHPTPIRLIDFDDPGSNSLIVSREVVFKAGGEKDRRYDIVMYVNGFPLAVGETKTPVKDKKSWLNAALDITETYEPRNPAMFVPNVLSFATEGKDFRYGPIGMPAVDWLPWSSTTDEMMGPGLKRALRSVELLLSPERILEILRDFTLYSIDGSGLTPRPIKIIPRYPQVEAVRRIVERATDPARHQGLLREHQGSGKTLLMAFAATKLLRAQHAPTIVIVLDRLDLDEQTTREFASAGLRLKVAASRDDLRRMLGEEDRRGVIVTTIFRFREAGVLNDRSNISVFCDEAHRTQEGLLSKDMRDALPNATFIGLTGTPISTADRDTFERFGHPDDPGHLLHEYDDVRSIHDGATLQVISESRLVDLHIDEEALDEAFEAMAAAERLTDEEKETLAKKAVRLETIFKAPSRIRAVCEDIVDHYERRIAPLGLKALVVAYDRELCVRYQEEISQILAERGEGWQSTVVMTTQGKDDPPAYQAFERDRAQEADVKRRFRTYSDPLKIVIVTAKWLTGFDAKNLGVLYLDKPLRAHTLFQAMTRTNRTWTNPETKQEKTAGLVIDYIGLGSEIAKAVQIRRRERGEKIGFDDLVTLQKELRGALETALDRFEDIDRSSSSFEALMQAQDRLASEAERDQFAREFLTCQALYEFLEPDTAFTSEQRKDYRWVAKVYQSVQPALPPDALLWQRLGAKTHALIAKHIGEIEVGKGGPRSIVLDDESIEQLKLLGMDTSSGGKPAEAPTAADVLDTIRKRIEARLTHNPSNPRYRSLAERLESLRQTYIDSAEESIEFLKKLLEIAREVVQADREQVAEEGASAVADTATAAAESLLPDQRVGALTQIFEEYKPDVTPDIVERVVKEIDAVVMAARFSGWQTSREGDRTVKFEIRRAFKKYGLEPTGELFDRAYAYVAEHY